MLERDRSAIGTVLGITVVVLAVSGSVLFDWEWGAPDQPVPMAIGLIAAVAAVLITIQIRRN